MACRGFRGVGGDATVVPYIAEWGEGCTVSGRRHGARVWVGGASVALLVAADGEIVSLRTAFSDTFVQGRSRVAHIYASPVNYRDGSGGFVPIDDTLVASGAAGYAAGNAAGPYAVQFPADLAAAPVTVRLGVAAGAATLSMRLAGAAAVAPVVSGDRASYRGALAGVDVVYQARGSGVKESLVLVSPAAAGVFTEAVTVPAGVRLSAARSGAVMLTSAGGQRLASLPAATVVDAAGRAGPVSTTLVAGAAAGSYTLRVSVAPGWLRAPARVFPVTVDPTVTVPIESSTFIEGGPDAGSNYGSCATVYAGYDAAAGAGAHGLLFFDALDVLPWDATVESATLGVWVDSLSGGASTTVQAYAATKAWTASGATWTSYDGTHAWSSPGGDFQGAPGGGPYGSATVSSSDTGGYVYLFPTKAVAAWLTGALPQDGFLIRTPSDSTGPLVGLGSNNAPSGQGPFLDVAYQSPSGLESDQSYAHYTLDDHLRLNVDVGSNDAQLAATDADIAGVGQPLQITRSYDENQSDAATGDLGEGWLFDPGPDTALVFFPDTTVYYDPTGGAHVFSPDGSGGWATPPATDATLTHTGSTWTLAFHHPSVTDTFNSAGQLVSRADRNGNTITVAYVSPGSHEIASITDTEGRTVSFTYAGNQIASVTDWAGRTTSYGYDPSATFLTSVTDSNGGVTTYGYDPTYGYLTSVTTPAGRQITLDPTYSRLTLTQVSDIAHGTGPSTSFAYSGGASPGDDKTDTVSDPDGHQSRYTISATRDEITKVSDANGHTRSTSYTPNGQVASLADAMTGPNTTTFGYDPNDNLTKITAPDTGTGAAGWSRSYGYTDAAHPYQPTSQTDGQHNSTSYSYDSPGNTASVHSGPATLTAAYQGDPGTPSCGAKPGELCSNTDANGHSTNYSYYPDGDLQTVTPPAPLGATSYSYDSLSRVASTTDGRGDVTRYSYDGLDRPTQVLTGGATSCVLASGHCMQLSYDSDGSLLTRSDASGTTTWSYDPLGRVTTKTLPGTVSTTVTYDGVGNVLSYTDPGGTVAYGYDPANNLTSLTEPGGSCTSPTSRCTTFFYDADNQRTEIDYPSGETIKIGYDTDGRETSLAAYRPGAGTAFLSRTYSYATAAGADSELRQSVTDRAGVVISYGYDTLNRLVSATASSGPSYSYSYDPAGNLTGGSLGSHSYNAANQLTDPGYAYDGAGNLTATAAGLTAGYNAAGQTTPITPPGGSPIALTYAGTTQNELLTAGTTSYTNSLLGVSAQTTSSASVYLTRDPAGNLISMRQGTAGSYTSSYYTLDAQGSVLRLTDASGLADVAAYSYDPYGNTTSATGTLAGVNPYRYASGYYDTTTGLYHYGNRYYQPSLGRWTQQDQQQHLGDLTQSNLYAYTGDNPTNAIDPTGQSILGTVLSVAVGVVGVGLGVVSGGLGFSLFAAGDLLGGLAGIAAAAPPFVGGVFAAYYGSTA